MKPMKESIVDTTSDKRILSVFLLFLSMFAIIPQMHRRRFKNSSNLALVIPIPDPVADTCL